MSFRFPLEDVTITITTQPTGVKHPAYSDEWMQLNQNEFALNVEGVARFYVCNGNTVEICPAEGYNPSALELYLNGSVYGAILHQRMILPMHGSCFNYQGQGIMVCGESGAGKSSVTASFSLHGGAEFLTDDVTPILFTDGKPMIWAMSDRIKLWTDSLQQLKQEHEGLPQIDGETEKFYFPMESDKGKQFPLHRIILLEIHDRPEVIFQEIGGIEKFTALRNEIYRWEYLQGMPVSEAGYFKQLVNISQEVKVTKLFRPAEITIIQLHAELEKYL